LRDSLAGYRTPLGRVLEVWAAAVGEEIASHARPTAIREGVLVLEADDPAWAGQLRWLGADLLARLAEAAGSPVAERLEVRVKRP
jgi:predicted nucleic acid-binding Zn ribbon protein